MKKISFFTLLFIMLANCSGYKKISEKITPNNALVKVGWFKRPLFKDDYDKESLLKAIQSNNFFLNRMPADKEISIGEDKYTVAELKETYEKFLSILNDSSTNSEFNKKISEHFDIYCSTGRDNKSNVLFTGYYEPVLKGAKEKSDAYPFPIYRRPEDLIEINLGDFNSELSGRRIIARIDKEEVKPYFDRKSIETMGSLFGRKLEIAWLSNPLDIFFLHVQGSGIIEFEDGTSINVNYAAANGRPYRSVGRLLIDTGKISKEKMSMKAIREYLEKNPDEIDPVLNHNESYVFFRTVEEGPIGSTGVILTGGRSIASDSNLFPKGGLAYIETEIPVTDMEGNILEWKKMSRFVIDQDKGGAIKGPARIDIFFGTGDEAGRSAGAMNRNGKLFYLVKKKN